MRRREFIAALGSAAVAWPLAARAERSGKLPTVGVLGSDATAWHPWTVAFVERLRELGWIEGRTIAFEYRWSQARPERAAELAAELVHLKVDIIVTAGPHVATVKKATAVIPIVFALTSDPVGSGWQVWRDRVATPPGCRPRELTLPPSAWSCCVNFSLGSAGWQS
jgi:putative tryptophan/tyrosine transport system substrate-binding protein